MLAVCQGESMLAVCQGQGERMLAVCQGEYVSCMSG